MLLTRSSVMAFRRALSTLFQSKHPFIFLILLSLPSITSTSQARPPGPEVICAVWEDAKICQDPALACTPCHTSPPVRDLFGQALEAELWPGDQRPENDQAFATLLTAQLDSFASLDSDQDGHTNLEELEAGSDPGDADSKPTSSNDPCAEGACNAYDIPYAFRRVLLDVCGRSPTWEEFKNLKELNPDQQREQLHESLDQCFGTAFWMGRDGVLWRMAHSKIRPIQAIKSGQGAGSIPLGDYDPDYALFAYAYTGDRDARDVLLADYFVTLTQEDPPQYETSPTLQEQNAAPNRRAGMITTRWFMVINTMFTAVPRTTAAQAYRSYLGLDIAKSEGLIEPPSDFEVLVDYDDKGITQETCASCHRTLDPLSYPFTRYHGIQGNNTGAYTADRLEQFNETQGMRIQEVPEQGAILGQTVADLMEWSDVAAQSDQFAKKVTLDFWMVFIGEPPKTARDQNEFAQLWQDFKDTHTYRVEALIHDLVNTEAYGAP